MTITRQVNQSLGLENFKVWIEDTTPDSRYFQLSQVPDVFTAGKIGMLINGSDELVTGTEILVELLDSENNTVFSHPIRNYTEGLARLISFEVYEDTPEGLGTLTILGQVARDENGNIPPDEFMDAYNVRWQKKIVIASRLGNINRVRLQQYPTASISEILSPVRISSQSVVIVTGSYNNEASGRTLYNFTQSIVPLPNEYYIGTVQPFFIKQMEGGTIQVGVDSRVYSGSVIEVLNNRMVRVEPGFINGDQYLSFDSTNFTMSYSGSPDYIVTQFTRSYADVNISGLTTLTGDIFRTKIFVTSENEPTEYELLGDFPITAAELMVTSSLGIGQQKIRTGYFTDDDTIKSSWLYGTFESMSVYNPQ